MKTYSCIKVDQPIGRFYITALPATVLAKITRVDPRDLENETGIQRQGKSSRIKEIIVATQMLHSQLQSWLVWMLSDNNIVH